MTPQETFEGVLVLYRHPPVENAPTIMEHVGAFSRHSRFPTFAVNTGDGFPRILASQQFRVVVLHYSVFALEYQLPKRYLSYLARSGGSYKVAFFQDEHHYCRQRFDFIDRYGIDAVYTLLEPPYHEDVYGEHSSVPTVRTTLPGYVGDDLVQRAREMSTPEEDRAIDVGYRARPLAFYMGRGAQEKHEIGARFVDAARGTGLRLDIATDERSRIYGHGWYRHLANCRAVLGVEAGASVFDLDDSARTRTEQLLKANPSIDFETVARCILDDEYEGRIPYRTISPRHFEAAAFRVVQILYEGHYSGILQPDIHYLPVAKDFSNIQEILTRLGDPAQRRRMTERAYDDLIASGRYSYARFVHEFDEHLFDSGLRQAVLESERREVARHLRRRHRAQAPLRLARSLRYRPFPGRDHVARVFRTVRAHGGSQRVKR